MKKITLIIPCYNEDAVLRFLYQEICSVGELLYSRANIQYELEMIFIDDGSKDGTLAMIRELAKQDTRVRYLSFSRNFGKEAAMYAGFCNASGDYAAVMDADMQDPPSILPEMVEILENQDYDSVAARRMSRKGEPVIRSCFAKLFYKVMNKVSDADIVDGARDFRLMKREMVQAVIQMGECNRFSKGIFGWVGFRTYWYEYENVERAAGTTKWSFWSLFRYSIDGILNFSSMPLMVISGLGIIFTLISVAAIIAVIIRKLAGIDSAYGWASLICVIIFFHGLQLLCIGIVGRYIAKIYQESKHRPHYVAREISDESMKKIL